MTLRSPLRKLALGLHVIASVGWLGAALAFVALAVVGLTNDDAQTVRGAYLVMEPAARYVLLPLAIAAPLTGLVLSLGTSWGLLRHYWVLFKAGINTFATLVLISYMDTFRLMADTAGDTTIGLDAVRNPSPLMHGSIAVGLLLVAVALSVFKPRGTTRYGRRRQEQPATRSPRAASPPPTDLERPHVLVP